MAERTKERKAKRLRVIYRENRRVAPALPKKEREAFRETYRATGLNSQNLTRKISRHRVRSKSHLGGTFKLLIF
jgi:hypothetical protein